MLGLEKTDSKNKLIKRHNATITIKAKLSLTQRKLMSALLFNAYNDLQKRNKHRIPYIELCEMIGLNSHNYENLRKNLTGLMTTLVEWDYRDDNGKPAWAASAMLASAKIEKGVVIYSYSDLLAEELYNPDIYTRINMEVVKKISKSHSLVIYELCAKFINVGTTGWLKIGYLRDLLGISGMKTYKEFWRIKEKILTPAIDEINSNTNIEIKIDYKTEGRKTVEVKFLVSKKQIGKSHHASETIINSDSMVGLRELGVGDDRLSEYLKNYPIEYLNEKIDITRKAMSNGVIKKSVGGFLMKAIEEDYRDPEIEQEKLAKKAAEKRSKLNKIKSKIESVEQTIRDIERAYAKKCREAVKAYCDDLPEVARNAIKFEFSSTLSKTMMNDFKKRGWLSPIVPLADIKKYWNKKIDFPDVNDTAVELGLRKIDEMKDEVEALKQEESNLMND